MNTIRLINRIHNLPEFSQQEILDFVEFISYQQSKSLRKKSNAIPKKFSFNWQGALKEYKNKFTSVELQHKANEWRNI